MGCLYNTQGLLKLVLGSLMLFPGARLKAADSPNEPEDSPLYAVSLHGAFADMAARDQGILHPLTGQMQGVAGPDTVIIVSGARWSRESGLEWENFVEQVRQAGQTRSGPLDLTYSVTCNLPTTQCVSCVPTRCGGVPTCVQTCVDPGITCMYPTCNAEPTCSGPTCTPYSCMPTSCAGTCTGTCVPAYCPTRLIDVHVPQAGQIELSFSSSAQLNYVLQYCTNLTAGTWAQACTNNGNGGVLTLRHTNGATMAAYRLLIQTP